MSDLSGNLHQLKQVIDLAEKSSEKSDEYKSQASRYRIILSMCLITFSLDIIGAYSYLIKCQIKIDQIDKNGLVYILSLSLLGFATGYFYFRLKEVSIEYQKETRILSKLLEMIDELKRYVFSFEKLDPVEKALIEMRLSRISFFQKDIHFVGSRSKTSKPSYPVSTSPFPPSMQNPAV